MLKNQIPQGRMTFLMIFLSHLPLNSRKILLSLLSLIWNTQTLPTSWKHAIIIPIPNPNIDLSLPSSYRPIALTSCMCKITETMINSRLIWYLENNHLLSSTQSGFRKNRSTLDQLVALETSIQKAFLNKEFDLSVFLDFQKAYNMLWRDGLLLKKMDIAGNMYGWIPDFLHNRSISVRINSSFSEKFFSTMVRLKAVSLVPHFLILW